jgi:hypothetical protein
LISLGRKVLKVFLEIDGFFGATGATRGREKEQDCGGSKEILGIH